MQLAAMTHGELKIVATATNAQVDTEADKTVLIIAILKAAGYVYAQDRPQRERTRPTPVDSVSNIYDALQMYCKDEVMLLRATASMLESICEIANNTYTKDNLEVTGRFSVDAVKELEHYHGHTNMTRIVTLLRRLMPKHGLSE